MKSKLEKILNFLNKDISKLFKKEYDIKFLRREDKGQGVFEAKRYNKKTGEESPYEVPLYLQTVIRKNLLCD